MVIRIRLINVFYNSVFDNKVGRESRKFIVNGTKTDSRNVFIEVSETVYIRFIGRSTKNTDIVLQVIFADRF